MTNLNIADEVTGIALAAGLGTRLRPLTLTKPKPLVPFFGVEILAIALNKLKETGVTSLGVNSHYMSDLVQEFVDLHEQKAFVSLEKEKILGTAGCYPAFDTFRAGKALLTSNGDVISSTSLNNLYELHKENDAVATMAVLDKPHPKGSQIWVKGVEIVHIGPDDGGNTGATPHGFACYQVLEEAALNLMEPQKYEELVNIYLKLLADGKKVCAYVHSARWFDLGTHRDYFDAHMYVLDKLSAMNPGEVDEFGILNSIKARGLNVQFIKKGESKVLPGDISVTGPSAIIGNIYADHGAEIGPNTVIMDGVTLEARPAINNSVILPGATVSCDTENLIVDSENKIEV